MYGGSFFLKTGENGVTINFTFKNGWWQNPKEWSQGFKIIGDDVIIIAHDPSLSRNYGIFIKFNDATSIFDGTWKNTEFDGTEENTDGADIKFFGNICSVNFLVYNPDGSWNGGRSGTRFTYTGTNNSGTIYFDIGYGGVVCPVSYTLAGDTLTLEGDLPDGFYKLFIGKWSKQ